MLTDITDSSYVTAIAYGDNPMTFQLDMTGTVAIPGDPALARNNDAMECLDCGRDNTGHEGEPCSDDCPSQSRQWEDLDAFTQGYVEAVLRAAEDTLGGFTVCGVRFSDLAPETLARIIEDCVAWRSEFTGSTAESSAERADMGRGFWRIRQDGKRSTFPPLTVQLGDDGKVGFA